MLCIIEETLFQEPLRTSEMPLNTFLLLAIDYIDFIRVCACFVFFFSLVMVMVMVTVNFSVDCP